MMKKNIFNKIILYFVLMLSALSATALMSKVNVEKLILAVSDFYGDKAAIRVRGWRQLVDGNQDINEESKLLTVNNFFNQLHFLNDIDLWDENDYWATPVEFIGANGGDCEDFSIAKYFTLLELGISDEKMRMVYVKAIELDQFHMVVAYYETPSSVPVILDNINGEILPATERSDLAPVYSFNGSHLWLMKERGRGKLAGESSRINLWNELRSRFKADDMRKPVVDLEY